MLTLSKTQLDFYEEEGFLILKRRFPEDEVAALREDLFNIVRHPWEGSARLGILRESKNADKDPLNPLGVKFVMQSPLLGDRWMKLCLDERLVMPMVDILGPDVNLHDQKIPMKPPGHVSEQRWHQDWVYERHDRPELAAALLYLDHTSCGAGATKLWPKSHKLGEIEHVEGKAGLSIPDDKVGDWLQPEMDPGDVLLVHTWLAHSIGDNHSDETKAMVAHVYKSAKAVDTHGNNRQLAELPVARNGKLAFSLNW